MSEENDGQQVEVEQEQGAQEFKPITSQDELNRLIGARIEKVKSQFGDYDDLKSKASKLDEIEQASKSELEKAQERIAELEKATSAAQRAALVTRVAAEEDVIPEVLTGDTEEEMRATAKRIKEWAQAGRRTPPNPNKLQSGSSGSGEQLTGKERAAAAVRQLRGN